MATRAYLVHVKDDMVEFMQLLARAVKVALARCGKNSVVRIKHSAVEGSVVLKYATTLDKSRFAREVAMWNQHKSWIGEIPNLVSLHARSAELFGLGAAV